MATGLSGIDDLRPSEGGGACFAGASTAEVLRMLSAGATGAILMALGKGPLRTKTLTEQVPGYAPRTIYRYAGRLAELEVIEREEEPGVPSKVVHNLTDPCGADLYALVDRYADASLSRLPDGRVDARTWASLGLLADMWEAGMVEDLSCEGRSPTDLARGRHELSYHQVNRRAGLLKTGGLLEEWQGPGRSRHYGLTEKTRRKMGLLTAIARWRHHHVAAGDEEGMTAEEMATVLKVALPLVRLPEHRGKCLLLEVRGEDATGSEGQEVWAEVKGDGSVHSCAEAPAKPDAWGHATVAGWMPVVLDGQLEGIETPEDEKLALEASMGLFDALWNPHAS
jgi:DNA-binding HxlR family transcriptional regulator